MPYLPASALAETQDPAVILEHIRDGAEAAIAHPDDECGIDAGGFCTPHGALCAVAALDAVLKLTRDSAGNDKHRERVLTVGQVREAITRALTGKEAGDETAAT